MEILNWTDPTHTRFSTSRYRDVWREQCSRITVGVNQNIAWFFINQGIDMGRNLRVYSF